LGVVHHRVLRVGVDFGRPCGSLDAEHVDWHVVALGQAVPLIIAGHVLCGHERPRQHRQFGHDFVGGHLRHERPDLHRVAQVGAAEAFTEAIGPVVDVGHHPAERNERRQEIGDLARHRDAVGTQLVDPGGRSDRDR
jgi:hypothetical protein